MSIVSSFFRRQKEEREATTPDSNASTVIRERRLVFLSDIIGPTEITDRLRVAIAAAKNDGKPLKHVLRFGSAG